ncbi:hypothetical protein [Sphingomonas sp. Leaf357]|uniref:hypothetical protein n=1 Tax=Sphingomonas sp. Leaf357 TaxID=1736350 RepID=UPI0009E9CEBF|nr:hypothetical protein [Sphingomonas sp. Leaf357]
MNARLQTMVGLAPMAAARDPAWLPHRYDPSQDAIQFLPVPRAMHQQVTFITDEYLPKGLASIVLPRTQAKIGTPSEAPLHFVFHSAFCCSTMLARAFERPGWAMGLKEPVILNDIVGWRRRGGQGADMATVLDDVLALLARPFAPGEAVIVKPSNIVNCLAAAILTLRPNARAVLLHAPLRTYLGSIARKGMDGRLWVRTLLQGLMDDKLVDFGFTPRDYLGLTDMQAAAVGWLAQQGLFARLIEQFGPKRVATIDSAAVTGDPSATMRALATLFGLPLEVATLDEILAGPAFTRHSKLETAFTAGDRAQEVADGNRLHAPEIEMVAHWAEVVAETMNVPVVLPAPLLSR